MWREEKRSDTCHLKMSTDRFLTEVSDSVFKNGANERLCRILQKKKKKTGKNEAKLQLRDFISDLCGRLDGFFQDVNNNKTPRTESALCARDHDDVNNSLVTLKRRLFYRSPLAHLQLVPHASKKKLDAASACFEKYIHNKGYERQINFISVHLDCI